MEGQTHKLWASWGTCWAQYKFHSRGDFLSLGIWLRLLCIFLAQYDSFFLLPRGSLWVASCPVPASLPRGTVYPTVTTWRCPSPASGAPRVKPTGMQQAGGRQVISDTAETSSDQGRATETLPFRSAPSLWSPTANAKITFTALKGGRDDGEFRSYRVWFWSI